MDNVEKIKQLFEFLSEKEKTEIMEFIKRELQVPSDKKSKGIFTGPAPASEENFCSKCGKKF